MTLASWCGLAALLALLSTAVRAETVSVKFRAGETAEVVIDSAVDDRNFQDPRGYQNHGSATRFFLRRMTLTNTGATPLTGPLLVVNGEDWSRAEGLLPGLEPRVFMPRLFALWRDHVTHADSDLPGVNEPLALLNFWGYALCGDTTSALARLAVARGIPARKIPLNGHVAAEYLYDGAWHIFDADQNLCYLKFDNRTLASAADLRADPLLARRTKPLGRHAPMRAEAAAFNTALHEFVAPEAKPNIKVKQPPAPVRDVTLFPGETMIVHCAQAPGEVVGRTDLSRWGAVREDALRLLEFAITPRARAAAESGGFVFAAGHPILRAVNHTTGEVFTLPAGQPHFEVAVKFARPEDRISVCCQRSNASLPRLRKGRNAVTLAAAPTGGRAQLVVEWEPAASDLVIPQVTTALVDATPAFKVQSQPVGDQLWWQISGTEDFAFVPPNLDAVSAFTERIALDPLSATFLNPGEAYFFRARARHLGVWGEWSAPLSFRVEKPQRPTVAVGISGANLRLTWPSGGAGCEYLVFGSNRLDFVPELFAAEEIVAMRDDRVLESRPNKNLLAVVARPEIELPPRYRFYRVITRRAGVLSVPGDLLVCPLEFAAGLPPATVLQDRWRRVDDPGSPGAQTDEHLATEMPLR